jgi:hypothetical protein
MRKFTWLLALAVPVTIISCQKDAVQETSNEDAALVQAAGNGAPQGSHLYQLNIIGVPKEKRNSFNPETYQLDNNNGKRMFVLLDGSTQIGLVNSDNLGGGFDVLDYNGTDGKSQFMLPSADLDNDGVTKYSVWARALGKPGGQVKVTTCATDPVDGGNVCSLLQYLTMRDQKSKFADVSKYLLYIYADLPYDGIDGVVRVPLFDPALQDYYWQYDNNGMKLLQLRFYGEASQDIPDPSDVSTN